MPYEPSAVEPRWQAFWARSNTFVATEDPSRPKFYALDMFPYPSGKGLHVGHPAGYTASDVVSRYKRARGFNVLHPMGFDSFGLPAEQKAIEEGVAPQLSTAEALETFRGQLKRLGMSYDWSREVSTCDPAYYRWTQWIFARLYEQGLATRADTFVNWCEALGTVLANDEVIDGKSERGGHPVVRMSRQQWMLKITRYAEQLLQGLDTIDWPEATKVRQREWIGRSEGARVSFAVSGVDGAAIEVFTTRPDTLWGATFVVLAPEHALVDRITTAAQRAAVDAYRAVAASKSEVDRQAAKEKTGVDTGARAVNPSTGQVVPVWIADYVLAGYGTGAIMAVPGHDDRDWAFARANGLPIVEVISGGDVAAAAHTGEGRMVNSGRFDGTETAGGHAVREVVAWLEAEGKGRREITYKLRDWTFARQRYWGEPIPVLLDEAGRVARALRDDELPLELPDVDSYAPLGTGESPLARAQDWVRHEEGGRALRRETDTMPGSAGSSWYFLRYCDPHNTTTFCDRAKSDYWMPVDLYVGGAEHTVGHLLYARMWQRFLHEQGLVRDPEPFAKLVHQGMITAFTWYDPDKRLVLERDVEERGGKWFRKGTEIELVARIEKMSKRKGNVVNPDEVIVRFGADAMRVYICFMGPLEAEKPWQTLGLEGQHGFLRRLWRLYFEGDDDVPRVDASEPSVESLRTVHKAIAKVAGDIESLNLNTAISALHVATRDLAQQGCRSRAVLEPLCQLVAPFAPHFAEEVWAKGLGREGGISFVPWPDADPRWTRDDTVTIGVQVLGKTRGEVQLAVDADEATALAAAKAEPNVAKFLEGKELVKVIYKAGKILNLVVK
jgi:leucyl-tRNA synthetase